MRLLHTESSTGWGGQEIRILREAEGMRARGHEVLLAVNTGGGLIPKAREKGFRVLELPFKKWQAPQTIVKLLYTIRNEAIDLVNTHSSLDAWIGGVAARLARCPVIRTRHLSTAIRPGLNSRLLYKTLSDFVVTTSSGILPMIARQSGLPAAQLKCIPTGIDPSQFNVRPEQIAAFRQKLGLAPDDILIGTACFVRSWKGIDDLLQAARLLQGYRHLKWVVVGGGHLNNFVPKVAQMGLEGVVTFTGHLDDPFPAIAAMDLFLLLSTAHEGVSQASLQAAYLERPLITTPIGGLPEVCIDGITGYLVPPRTPEAVAKVVLALAADPKQRHALGAQARALVEERFFFQKTLDDMEAVYHQVVRHSA